MVVALLLKSYLQMVREVPLNRRSTVFHHSWCSVCAYRVCHTTSAMVLIYVGAIMLPFKLKYVADDSMGASTFCISCRLIG